MDTPRRWQVASLATAVAGLGVGGMLIGRPAVDEVEAIELEHLTPSAVTTADPDERLTLRPTPEIVEADVIGASEDTATTVETAGSVASPEEPTGSPVTTPAPPSTSTTPTNTSDAPTNVDSPNSVDSVSSLDS